jgi:hypothetical protein
MPIDIPPSKEPVETSGTGSYKNYTLIDPAHFGSPRKYERPPTPPQKAVVSAPDPVPGNVDSEEATKQEAETLLDNLELESIKPAKVDSQETALQHVALPEDSQDLKVVE